MNHVFYVKYLAAITILVAMVFHVKGITPINSYLQIIGAMLWIYVGYQWKENSIILNFLPQLFIIIPLLLL